MNTLVIRQKLLQVALKVIILFALDFEVAAFFKKNFFPFFANEYLFFAFSLRVVCILL